MHTSLPEELSARSNALNTNAPNANGDFILVWLRRSLCAYDNPAIDVGIELSRQQKIPVVVFSQLSSSEPFMNDRLAAFTIGANKVFASALVGRKIQSIFATDLLKDDASDLSNLQSVHAELIQRSAVIVIDQHFTAYERAQSADIASAAKQTVLEVDSTRLIPHSQFEKSLHVTKVFRAAHSPLRKKWFSMRQDSALAHEFDNIEFKSKFTKLIQLTDSAIQTLIKESDIDHSIELPHDHPATKEALDKRLHELPVIVAKYRSDRNNPALDSSTTKLSPYLHFGMTSCFQIVRCLEKSDIPRAVLWKFLDELLTWREWSHWRLAQRPDYINFESLPKSAKNTLRLHKDDARKVLLSEAQLFNGETPDDVWNAAQLYWRHTGWLHNNLRMYWATQILQWTKTPEEAWAIATKFNDKQSLDGQEPACYISMRWAFGESKPSYSEKPIYGWVAKKTDRALRKRKGFNDWLEKTLARYQIS